jgi:K+-transporting ATPase ATPase A chain
MGDLREIIIYVAVIVAIAGPLGILLAKVLAGKAHVFSSALGRLERLVYRLSGVRTHDEMDWRRYTLALLAFNALGFAFLLMLQLAQHLLPLNPEGLPNVSGWLAFNTAMSFVTNTNWQAYRGEATMSYLTQLLGLGVQNFLSAATGIAVMTALARGLATKSTSSIGNFWVDVTRSVVYFLLPLSFLLAFALISQGVIQNFSGYVSATTIDGASQTTPMGPAASQIAIKQLGSNGGGFFGANSALFSPC